MIAVIYILDHKGIMTQLEQSKAKSKRHYKGRIRNFQVTGIRDEGESYAKDDQVLVQRDKENTISSW